MLNRSDCGRQHYTRTVRDCIPVDTGKKLVLLNLLGIILRAKALLRVPIEQQKDNLASIMRHRVRNLERALLNVFEELGLRGVEVGRDSNEHLVDENT